MTGGKRTIDTRGMTDMQSTQQVQTAIAQMAAGTIEVMTDSETARDSVLAAARGAGWAVEAEPMAGGAFKVTLSK